MLYVVFAVCGICLATDILILVANISQVDAHFLTHLREMIALVEGKLQALLTLNYKAYFISNSSKTLNIFTVDV